MTNQYDEYEDDDFETEEAQGPAKLRNALKKAEKREKALMEELAALKGNVRQRSVKDVLEAKGVNPKIAAFIPAGVDAPEKIAAWLDEYADVFGFANQSQESAVQGDATARRIEEVTQTATTPTGGEDVLARLTSAKSKDELDQLIFGTSLGR
jgi:hypothetical protein